MCEINPTKPLCMGQWTWQGVNSDVFGLVRTGSILVGIALRLCGGIYFFLLVPLRRSFLYNTWSDQDRPWGKELILRAWLGCWQNLTSLKHRAPRMGELVAGLLDISSSGAMIRQDKINIVFIASWYNHYLHFRVHKSHLLAQAYEISIYEIGTCKLNTKSICLF